MSKQKGLENHKKNEEGAKRSVGDGIESSVDNESDVTESTVDQVIPPTTNKRTNLTSLTDEVKAPTTLTSSCGPGALHQLSTRQLYTDPYFSLHSFKPTFYSLKSHIQRMELERRLKEHEGCVNCIHFSHNGEMLASGSDDLHVVLWDWARGRKLTKFDSGHIANVFQAKFMPHTGDTVLVTAARDGQIRCHVMSTSGSLMTSKRVSHHRDSAHKLALEPDNPHVFLSCGEDGTVLSVDLRENPETRNKILTCKGEGGSTVPLYSIFIDPSNYNYFAISGRDQYARIYDRRVQKPAEGERLEPVKFYCPDHLKNPENEYSRANITCLVYSHDGKELLCSYNDEDIYLFDTSHSSGSNFIRKYKGHRNSATVKGVNFYGLHSEYVVSGSDCGHVFLWDKETEEIVQFMEADYDGVVNCLEPHPHIPVLATSGLDHDVKIFSPIAPTPTDLSGLAEIVKKNTEDREEALNTPMDGYDIFMQVILRQYRRGVQQQIGLENSDDSSDEGVPGIPNGILLARRYGDHDDDNVDAMDSDDDESEGDGEGESGRGRLRRCTQQ